MRRQKFGGSFQSFVHEFQMRHNNEGTALELVQMVVDTFPSFRDEIWLDGRKGKLEYRTLPLSNRCLKRIVQYFSGRGLRSSSPKRGRPSTLIRPVPIQFSPGLADQPFIS